MTRNNVKITADNNTNVSTTTTTTTTRMTSRRRRRRSSSFRHDVTGTMDRLRFSMIGHFDDYDADAAAGTSLHDDDNDNDDVYIDDEHDNEAELIRSSSLNVRQRDHQTSIAAAATTSTTTTTTPSSSPFYTAKSRQRLHAIVGQIPAILLIAMFHLMIGIPFGVSYFPIGWRRQSDLTTTTTTTTQDEDTTATTTTWIHGPFPVAGNKEALGIRMFLFSTIVGQVVFTLTSNFHNPIGLQMVENVPFCHALASIVITKHGYGMQSLATCLVMFGVASILVGVVFFALGYWQLGRIVYFFPTHVLVGCIGGIGVFIAKTGIEVTMDTNFGLSNIVLLSLWKHAFVLLPVVLFETGLRLLEYLLKDEQGKPRYSLLSPIYFCMITPVFYVVLWLLHIPLDSAGDFFFPALDNPDPTSGNNSSSISSSMLDEHLWDMWRLMDFSLVAWRTIFVDCMSTLVALILFSLIHVPINIPAFAISSKTDVDMNNELIAHGYSNLIAGALGGLQNYMAYTQSVLYDRSGGIGKVSGIVVAIVTCGLFVIGPTIASYIPRCMAGTLLLHVGTDLFLEGVYDSYGKYDRLEYGGIWLIVITMTLYGMDAAMIAGAIAAVSTYAVQSITYLKPIRGSMSAETLRSSCRTRDSKAQAIVNRTRSRIHVIQLQGHLFFGNMAQFTDSVTKLLKREEPWIVILDFSLVLSIDSSAAQAIFKLQTTMNKKMGIRLSIFVSGSAEGFPCEFNLSEQLSTYQSHGDTALASSSSEVDEETHLLAHTNLFSGSRVYETLDDALVCAEDALVAREDPSLLPHVLGFAEAQPLANENTTLDEEKAILYHYFGNICPVPVSQHDFEILFPLLEREEFTRGDFLWKQGSQGTCAKLLLRGTLIALLENEAGTSETIACGNMIGELSLVQGSTRMSSVMCTSDVAVLYSLSRAGLEHLVSTAPHVARLIDLILIEYLANRVQHVSNRIFETRCLPV